MKPNSSLHALLVALGSASIQAADLTWDIVPGTVGAGDSAITGGAGTWDTTNGNWTVDAGVNNVAWDNTLNATDSAIFGDTAGTVTLGSDVTMKQLGFIVTNYVIEPGAGPYKIVLGASGDSTTNSTTVQSIYGSSATKTINADIDTNGFDLVVGGSTTNLGGVISGSGRLIKVAGGTLTLSNNNTYTGKTVISAINTSGSAVNISSFNSVTTDVGLGTVHSASSSFGAPTTVADGTIQFGTTGKQAGAQINYNGSGETTDRVIFFAMNGNGAGKTFNNNGGGLLKFTSTPTKAGSNNNDINLGGNFDGEFVGGLNFIFRNFTKNGNGTWTLGDAIGNTGTTTVNGGTLVLKNGNPNATGAFAVKSGTTLKGSGSFGGAININNGGTLSPGASPGQMTILASLVLSATSNVAFELGGSTLGTEYDNITMDATTATALTYGGNLSVVNFGAYDMDAVSNTYDLFVLNSVTPTGDFASVTVNSISLTNSGGVWTGMNGLVSYEFDQATGVLSVVAPGGGSAYDSWATTNAPSPQTPDQDYDGDGVSNAVEFVLGGDKDTNDLGKLPVPSTSGGDMLFTFERDQASIDASTTVTIEVSTDLATWNTPPSPYAVPDADTGGVVNPGVTVVSGAGTDTVTLRVPQGGDTKKFARLKVAIAP